MNADEHLEAARASGFEFVAEPDPAWLNPRLVEKLPVDWARTHQLIPIERDGVLFGLAANPVAIGRLDELSLLLGRDVYPLLTSPEAVRRAIDQCYAQRETPQWGAATSATPAAETRGPGRAEDLLRDSDDAPVAQYVNGLLLDAVRRRASDVHVEPFESHLQVRFRVDGFLYAQPQPPKSIEAALVSRLKVMARLDIAEHRLPQDGMAKVRVGAREFDIRVSTVPVAEGERVVLRLLNQESLLRPLGGLGMPASIESDFRRVLAEPNGVVLVTGPTGSGKTTTLYAALQGLDTARLNVMTIEDPIEYQLPGIAQIQVKPKIGLTFAQGLRHILRQDPDVVLLGEIRDAETAEIAIRASLTGHLVFSTLHTNDALSAVVRLVDMGVPSYLLASALRGCLAQRLVRQLCPACRRISTATEDELRALGPKATSLRGQPVWRPVGCPDCLGGYRDRAGLYEWIRFDASWETILRHGVDGDALRQHAQRSGCSSLLDDGIDRIRSGATSVEEVFRVIGSSAGSS
ncbi:MAG TPA: ATPase, T2SS/T4P/T4SS family [Kiritimatiellia bacterium]|nr:ATPase, T2SS/T4P/T4SS family [Kiritimatiellia bacterium]